LFVSVSPAVVVCVSLVCSVSSVGLSVSMSPVYGMFLIKLICFPNICVKLTNSVVALERGSQTIDG